jgi:tetratricopeptide (TPR) repeat protein
MPQIHTIAACTGPMIAIEVPKQGPRNRHFGLFDWLKVLRHEYTHTVTLDQTSNRIPHWLTEAAAVSMEFAPRDWGTCQMLARELEQGTLFDLESINWGFVRPRRPQDRSLAYAQGHWMVEFMNERFGDDALVRLLEIYRRGVREERAVPEALGVSRDAFYRSFLAWAREQVKSWGLAPSPRLEDIVLAERSRDPGARAELESAMDAALGETAARIAAGIGEPGDPKRDRLTASDWSRPELPPLEVDDEVMGRWLAAYPDHPDILERALRRSIDRLGDAPLDPLTRELLERYRRARPVDPYPRRILARAALASTDPTAAIPHLVELDAREENDNAYALELARLHRQRGDGAAASASAERAVRMNPYDAAIRELAAAIAIEAGGLETARLHVWALTRLEPDQPTHALRLARIEELIRNGR